MTLTDFRRSPPTSFRHALRALVFSLLGAIFAAPAWGTTVQLEMRPRIAASADYLKGHGHKPAVLVLHGFLQTREFSTVATLAKGLHDAGYTVLTPTLTLGVPMRRQSLPCEAIHRHSMDDDLEEIGRWVNWLKLHGHRSVVLVGHSYGSLQLLAYLSRQPDKVVKAFLGASLVETQIGQTERGKLIAELERRAARPQHTLMTHPLSLCRKYTSTPESLLSYVRWGQTQTLAALRSLDVPTLLVMGDADSLVERNWMRALAHIQVPLFIVNGANHFLDGQHEFDLLDKTLDFLGRIPGGGAR